MRQPKCQQIYCFFEEEFQKHFIYLLSFEIFDVLVNYYYYPWLVYELSKTIFLGDSSFQCNLFTSSSGTNEIFTNLLYDLTPYHIYKKFFL